MDTSALMRTMALDDYAEWMLRHRSYDVDVVTGVVVNARTGRPLKGTTNRSGYIVVGLVFNRRVVRQVKAHRLLAIKVWGVRALRGKHIAHLDGNPAHNTVTNLRPLTSAAHVALDGSAKWLTSSGRIPRWRQLPAYQAPRKTAWPPCVRCGDPDGPTSRGAYAPNRISGQRFGIEGALCRRCYRALQERERRAHRTRRPPDELCHGDVLVALADAEGGR